MQGQATVSMTLICKSRPLQRQCWKHHSTEFILVCTEFDEAIPWQSLSVIKRLRKIKKHSSYKKHSREPYACCPLKLDVLLALGLHVTNERQM